VVEEWPAANYRLREEQINAEDAEEERGVR